MKHRINIFVAVLLLTGLFVAPFYSSKISAAGLAPYYLTLTSSGTSANTGSKITLTAYAYALKCANLSIVLQGEACSDGSTPEQSPRINKQLFIMASDVTVEGAVPDGDKYYFSTGDDGKAQFTVSSANAGTRQVTVSSSYPAENGPQSVSLTFKTVAATPAPASKPKTPAPAPAPAPAPIPEPPKTPEIATLQIAGQDVVDRNNITVESNKPFELKGKTVPNGVVKLYIFSNPREATVTADAAGNWTYTLEGLEPGSHHVEAEVTDPTTQKTSARGNLLAFTVQEAKKVTPASTTTPAKRTSKAWIIWTIGALILITGAVLWLWLKKHRQKAADAVSPASTATPTKNPTSQEDVSAGPSDNDSINKQDPPAPTLDN